jgi:outer membrane protein OmpA-like peptidoglycan-associated protein
MSRLTPYSGKFAGRKIDSGKLTVDLKYKIDKSRLAGENQIVVERLKLGGKVKSPDAVDLPLDFAIALMEDSNGVIDLGLPVSGNLDSPEFSFGALIWKALSNLLTKIVTSPFRALGALLPGGSEEDFKSVTFEPGRSDVPPPEKEKLSKLAAALQKRPQLKLTVQGRYNPEIDLAELRSAGLRRALAARQGIKLEPGEDPGPVDYSSPEVGKALEAMFTERFGADALKAIQTEIKAADDNAKKQAVAKAAAAAPEGEARDPGRPAKTLFTRLADAESIGEPELVGLADARSQAIAAELSGPGGVPAERVAISPPAAMEKEKETPPTAVLNLEAAR